MNVVTIDQEQLYELYDFTIHNNNNIIVLGPPGIGKTEIAKQVINKNNFKTIYLNLSVLEAPDFIGIPYIKNNRSLHALPDFLPVNESEHSVLLLDEIDKIAPELQAPLLELLQFKSINGIKLSIQSIILTGNRLNDNTFSSMISRAITNRSGIFNVKPNFECWLSWAIDNSINPLIINFLIHNKDLFIDTSTDVNDKLCFPSPRSWAMASHDLNILEKNNNYTIDFKYYLLAGYVGQDVARQFKLWLEYERTLIPKVDNLIDNNICIDISNMSEDSILIAAILALKRMLININQHKISNVSKWLLQVPISYVKAALKTTLNMYTIKGYNLLKNQDFILLFEKLERMHA